MLSQVLFSPSVQCCCKCFFPCLPRLWQSGQHRKSSVGFETNPKLDCASWETLLETLQVWKCTALQVSAKGCPTLGKDGQVGQQSVLYYVLSWAQKSRCFPFKPAKQKTTTFQKLASVLKGKEASSAGPTVRPGCSVRRNATDVSSEPTPAISPACPWAGGPAAFTSGHKKVQIFLLNFECTALNTPLWRRMDGLWCGEERSTDSCQCTKVLGGVQLYYSSAKLEVKQR